MKYRMITGASAVLAALACQASAQENTAADDMVMAILSGNAAAIEELEANIDRPEPSAVSEEKTESVAQPAPSETNKEQLPTMERVLTRPGAILLAEPADNAKASETYLPNYSIVHVLQEKGDWIQIQTNSGEMGWLKHGTFLPWKHQLVIQFEAPTGRQRTLFFADKETALKYADMTDEERREALAPVYQAIEEGKPVADKGIVACEPDGWATMNSNFYIMPITEFELEQSEIAAELGIQAIKVSAATENTRVATAAVVNDTTGMKMDIVFVMDLSRSMGPIKDQVLKSINNINAAISKNPGFDKDLIHFGFWGYRDSTSACPGIGYVTKDYTADGLVTADQYAAILKQAEATPVDSVDYAEDVLAGVSDAINHTKWRENVARVLILIGDAPGREPGKTDPFSARKDKPVGTAANKGVAEIVTLAKENNVVVGTAYVNVPRYKEHLPIARKQFETMATGETQKATQVINLSKADDFARFETDMVTWLVAQTKQAADNKVELKAVTEGQKFASALFNQAKVRWLSSAHEVGVTSDMSGWILDKDLSDSAVDAVKPCVLLNRQQLDTMMSMLEIVVETGAQLKGTSTEFLTALRAVVVAGAKDPSMLDNINVLSDSEFIPTFLKELPYNSVVMTLSNEYWQLMNSSEQDAIITTAKNKIQFYKDIYNNQDLWMKPDDNTPDDQKVVPIPLNMLP